MLRSLLPSLMLALALGALFAPPRALACIYPLTGPWTQRSDDGRFELSLSFELTHPKRTEKDVILALRELKTGKLLWKHALSTVIDAYQARFSPSGRYVAVVDERSEALSLHDTGGTRVSRWKLGEHLTKAEQQRVPRNNCGMRWVSEVRFEGDVLVLAVPQDGGSAPSDPPPPPLFLSIDPEKQVLTRRP